MLEPQVNLDTMGISLEKPTEGLNALGELISKADEREKLNREIVNLPTEYSVDGKTIRVQHKSAKSVVAINSVLLSMHKLQLRLTKVDPSSEEAFEEIDKIQQEMYKLGIDLLFHIINEKPFGDPEFSKDWIEEHVPLVGTREDKSLGENIISAYREKFDALGFFYRALEIRII